MAYRLTRTAENQIDDILLQSAREFGSDAAERYGRLILSAMAALATDPARLGALQVPNAPHVRAYPLRLARETAPSAARVRHPRHLVVFRLGPDGIVEILGLVHDRMVLSRAARNLVPRTG